MDVSLRVSHAPKVATLFGWADLGEIVSLIGLAWQHHSGPGWLLIKCPQGPKGKAKDLRSDEGGGVQILHKTVRDQRLSINDHKRT